MAVERETIVTEGGSGGSGAGLLIILALVLLLLIAGGLTIFNGGFSLGGGTVEVPKVTVTN